MILKWILLLPHRTDHRGAYAIARLASPSEDDCSWCFRVQKY